MRQEFVELRKLLEKDWTQGAFARDVMGKSVEIMHPDAVSFCIEGAMTLVALKSHGKYTPSALHEVLAAKLALEGIGAVSIPTWNDQRGRTKAEVLGFMDRVIETVE